MFPPRFIAKLPHMHYCSQCFHSRQAALMMMNMNKPHSQRVDRVSVITLTIAYVTFIAVYACAML